MTLYFREFDWTDIILMIDRDDDYGYELGTSLDLGLQKGGYFPHLITFYGSHQPNPRVLLEEASHKSRSKSFAVHETYTHRYIA